MDFSFRGGNCVVMTIKKETLVVDGSLQLIGLKDVVKKDAIYLATQQGFTPAAASDMVFDGPGDYEVRGISIKGIGAPRMIDHDDVERSTIFRITSGGVSIVVLGHVRAPLSEEELESIGVVDIVIIPVGGNGYTLDSHQATGVVAQLEPRVVIPTHYQDSSATYEVPQNDVEEFIKELGVEYEKTTQYKIKNAMLPAKQTIIELTRTS